MKGKAEADKKQLLHELVDASCAIDRFPDEMAILGNDPSARRYQDYALFMQKFGTSSEVKGYTEGQKLGPAGVKNRENVRRVCNSIAQELGQQIVEKAGGIKRLGGFNWERFACVQHSRLCNTTIIHNVAEDDFDDEL